MRLVPPRKYCRLLLLILVATVPVLIPPAPLQADDTGLLTAEAENLAVNGGYAVSKNGQYIVAHNLHKLFIPASTLKIATALTALHILGPAYRFPTFFYRDMQGNLYIKGGGDPFLISEEVGGIVAELKEHGCTEINDIYLDDTAFHLGDMADGAGSSENPYDAQNSALAVNFNTINVLKDTAGDVSSAEAQTPTLALMVELAAGLEPGLHRINITRHQPIGSATVSRYVGELFRAFQQQESIPGAGVIARKMVPDDLAPFYIHHSSKSLKDVIGPLMQFSNNFVANQIFLAAGAASFGYPATWAKGRQAVLAYLRQQRDLGPAAIQIFEGSGLSRKNMVSPAAMVQLLDSFKPYAELLVQEDGKLLKSGTLDGVYCYAGYFVTGQRLDSFALLLNQAENNRDRLLDILERLYRGK